MNFRTLDIWKRKYKGKNKVYKETESYMKNNNLYVITVKRDFEKMLRFVLPSINLNIKSDLSIKTIKTSHTIQSLREFIKKK